VLRELDAELAASSERARTPLVWIAADRQVLTRATPGRILV
jgi:hypothetical protein